MMRHLVIFLSLTVSITLLSGGSERAAAQLPPLPADLLFTTTTEGGEADLPRDIILRVDAETLDVTPFYIDNSAHEIMPISWSPQGDLLAVYRLLPPIDDARTLFPRQLCILNRDGILQQCLEDSPPMHYGGRPDNWENYFPVAWGSDGRTIIYQIEYPNSDSQYEYGRQLIEANLITGETRVIYNFPDPYPLASSPDLNLVAVGFGRTWGGGVNEPAYLLDLTTTAQIDISASVPDLTELHQLCLPFSPNSNYVTVKAYYDLASYAPEQDPSLDNKLMGLLVILDTQGTIQHVIGEPDGINTLWAQDCPGWSPDEQTIYFQAFNLEYKAFLMRYSLVDERLDVLYTLKDWPEQESAVYPPLIVSPDGEHVALTVADPPYNKRQVAVLYPDGEIRRIPSSYRFGLYPLWVPPLVE